MTYVCRFFQSLNQYRNTVFLTSVTQFSPLLDKYCTVCGSEWLTININMLMNFLRYVEVIKSLLFIDCWNFNQILSISFREVLWNNRSKISIEVQVSYFCFARFKVVDCFFFHSEKTIRGLLLSYISSDLNINVKDRLSTCKIMGTAPWVLRRRPWVHHSNQPGNSQRCVNTTWYLFTYSIHFDHRF